VIRYSLNNRARASGWKADGPKRMAGRWPESRKPQNGDMLPLRRSPTPVSQVFSCKWPQRKSIPATREGCR
jgi:hypothetical protein